MVLVRGYKIIMRCPTIVAIMMTRLPALTPVRHSISVSFKLFHLHWVLSLHILSPVNSPVSGHQYWRVWPAPLCSVWKPLLVFICLNSLLKLLATSGILDYISCFYRIPPNSGFPSGTALGTKYVLFSTKDNWLIIFDWFLIECFTKI